MSPAPLVLLLAVQSAAASDTRPKAPTGLSWEDADYVALTVARIERRVKAGKPASARPITLSDKQLNSYVALTLGPELPPAISDVSIRFEPDRFAANGTIDLDAVRSKLPTGGPGSLLAFVSGTVPVALKGRFQGADGQGRVEVEEALVAGFSLPPNMVAQIVAQQTRSAKRPEGFDLLSPFPLPWTARSIKLEPGRALVEFAQQPSR